MFGWRSIRLRRVVGMVIVVIFSSVVISFDNGCYRELEKERSLVLGVFFRVRGSWKVREDGGF